MRNFRQAGSIDIGGGISLVNRLITVFCTWSLKNLLFICTWSDVSVWEVTSYLHLLTTLWVKYEILAWVSQISGTIIEAIDVSLHRSYLCALRRHFHSEVHHEHVICLINPPFLGLFLDFCALDRKGISKGRNVLEVRRLCNFILLV